MSRQETQTSETRNNHEVFMNFDQT